MTTTLSTKAKALIDRPVIANVATVDAEGRPQLTPVWIDRDGDDLVFNTARGTGQGGQPEQEPACGRVGGRPRRLLQRGGGPGHGGATEEGADAHIDSLAKKYLGLDTYPMRKPGEVRVNCRVKADNVVMQSDGRLSTRSGRRSVAGRSLRTASAQVATPGPADGNWA